MQLWNSDHGHVIEACQDSLNKLQLDYLDLYLVHFPVPTPHTGTYNVSPHPSCYNIHVLQLAFSWLNIIENIIILND